MDMAGISIGWTEKIQKKSLLIFCNDKKVSDNDTIQANRGPSVSRIFDFLIKLLLISVKIDFWNRKIANFATNH